MDVLGEIVFGLLASGPRRRHRQPRPASHVRPTAWLTVGVVAVALQALILLATLAMIVRVAWAAATDDLLFVLGLIVLPLAFAAVFAGVSVIGWMARIIRGLLATDSSARIGLVGVGAGGMLVGGWVALLGLALPGFAILALGTTSALVAAVPGAWRSDPPSPW